MSILSKALLLVSFVLFSQEAFSRSFTYCNESPLHNDIALGAYSKIKNHHGLNGSFSWGMVFNVHGWYSVKRGKCRTLSLPDSLGFTTIYLAIFDKDGVATTSSYRSGANRGGHKICAPLKAFKYVATNPRHPNFSLSNCAKFKESPKSWSTSASFRGPVPYTAKTEFLRLNYSAPFDTYTYKDR